jgi:prevent-host-death family protein
MKRMTASAFKARCLAVLKEVEATREPVTITKRGSPMVGLVPVTSRDADVFGFMSGEFKIAGDIESPVFPSTGDR